MHALLAHVLRDFVIHHCTTRGLNPGKVLFSSFSQVHLSAPASVLASIWLLWSSGGQLVFFAGYLPFLSYLNVEGIWSQLWKKSKWLLSHFGGEGGEGGGFPSSFAWLELSLTKADASLMMIKKKIFWRPGYKLHVKSPYILTQAKNEQLFFCCIWRGWGGMWEECCTHCPVIGLSRSPRVGAVTNGSWADQQHDIVHLQQRRLWVTKLHRMVA